MFLLIKLILSKNMLVQKDKDPKLYKLGGSEWKTCEVKFNLLFRILRMILIKLYAEREAAKGYAFSPDGDMQREFETCFPISRNRRSAPFFSEIKLDMEKERPMDRLLCGDVGYGKTEVAIRAAFKAIADGKQVAIPRTNDDPCPTAL